MGLQAGATESHQTRPSVESSPFVSDQHAAEAAKSAVRTFSIVVGGPAYDFLLRLGAVRQTLPNVLRRILALIAVTWLPLLFLSLPVGLASGHQVKIPFLYDFSMYGRLLLTLPLLIVAEIVIDPAIRLGIGEFLDAGIVQNEELPKFENLLGKMQSLRDSATLEAVIFICAFFPTFLLQHEWTAGAISSWHTTSRGLTAAGWWFALFSTPLLRFIIYRWAFRYFIWALLLWRISHLKLVLTPTHPDRAAGLNFLGITQKHFGILFCALGCTFAGSVANGMAFEGLPLSSFKFLMAGFVVLSLVLGLLPLMLLASKLKDVRKAGLLEYGRLANTYTKSFDEKWVHCAKHPSEPLLGSGDIQSLADMGNSFAIVDKMRIAPIGKRLVLQLAAQIVLPLTPIIILGTPAPELVHAVMKMVM